MEYELVYDAARHVFDGWWILLPCILIIIIGWGVVKFFHAISLHWFATFREFQLAFAVLLTLLCIFGFGVSNGKTWHASKTNTCVLAEGKVENYKRTNSTERFTVQNEKFEYDAHSITGGYNKISNEFGPLYSGRHVRLCYIKSKPRSLRGNLIVRVEVAAE